MPRQPLDLFDPVLVGNVVASAPEPDDTDAIRETLQPWVTDTPSDLGELTLEQAFNADIFGSILGYDLARPGREAFQLLPKQQTAAGSGFPDLLFGQFEQGDGGTLDTDRRLAVGELKSPGTDLDGSSETDGEIDSPVEQAFGYANENGLELQWVIVTNMEEIRLYHQSSVSHFQRWAFEDFVENGELTEAFWRFYHLLHREALVTDAGEESRLEQLFQRDLSERQELTEDFYDFYRVAVEDVYEELTAEFPERADTESGRIELIQASQKLLHRGIVTCIFSDQGLLPPKLLENVLDDAREFPTRRDGVVYEALRDLFDCVDRGSTPDYKYDVFGYDGGLFAPDEILSAATLPDELFDRTYTVGDDTVEGVFGFHAYDFRDDLNEFVLGQIFQQSVADFERLHDSVLEGKSPFSETATRDDYGIYFTREGLTEFVAGSAIDDVLEHRRARVRERMGVTPGDGHTEDPEYLRAYLREILDVRVLDLSCGSGAFLVSCFSRLQQEAESVHDKLREAIDEAQPTLGFEAFASREQEILEETIYGNDILQEALEISKLSVWIRSAREKVSLGDLSGNFTAADALEGEISFETDSGRRGFGDFDLVVGNPPWGGTVSETAQSWLAQEFPGFDTTELDSYELFTLVALRYLNDDGRLAFVLPKTLLREDHAAVRQHLVETHTLERFHVLGANWFGDDVNMDSVVVQLHVDDAAPDHTFDSMTLVDDERRAAIDGEIGLAQLEAARAAEIPQTRCVEAGKIEPFRYVADDAIIDQMEGVSVPLDTLCASKRGVEMSKDGHVVQCPGCGRWTTPPRWPSPDKEKTCPHCDLTFEYRNRMADEHVVTDDPADGDVAYVHGDSYDGRYDPLERFGLQLGYDGIRYKDRALYEGDKLFVRQAGVGFTAAYEDGTVYCPQSVYVFKLRDDRQEMVAAHDGDDGWATAESIPDDLDGRTFHEFLHGVMNSRLFNYYVFKRFGELDGAQSFAKLTLGQIRSLPIPVERLSTDEGRETVAEIADRVDRLRRGEGSLGGSLDWEIERRLLDLYGLSPEQMRHVTEQMGFAAYHKKVKELYPDGRPPRPERVREISLAEPADD